MIRSFRDQRTATLFDRKPVKRLALNIQRAALRKLLILDAAESLCDLDLPPGNHLEKLIGDRRGQHSIRVNAQWRICFRWQNSGAEDVEIVDYH